MSKLPFLCQRCHVTSRHPPTVYDGFVLQNSQNANKIYADAIIAGAWVQLPVGQGVAALGRMRCERDSPS